jgi:hypothetical protein
LELAYADEGGERRVLTETWSVPLEASVIAVAPIG